ncbi:MAG: CHAD domain-containing protein [Ktedonobacteraceae bacterium]|nr:CHAD domain-containing protein [Ktedonobacteraceae bacterium]
MAKARPITGLDPQTPTGENARLIASVRLDEMYAWEPYVHDPCSIQELHNLRIAAKRLRYTLEVFEDVLPEACVPIVAEVTQIQEELGAIHDSDVMIALLRLCLVEQGNAMHNGHNDDTGTTHRQSQMKEDSLVRPALATILLDPAVIPTFEELRGLRSLLLKQQHLRERQFATFYKHWNRLQKRDFRHEVLDILHMPASSPVEVKGL